MVRIGTKGRGRAETQMDYIQPLTIASYRAGLPKTARHRHAHTLIYDLLIEQLKLRGAEQPEKNLGEELEKAVGEGVDIGPRAVDTGIRRRDRSISMPCCRCTSLKGSIQGALNTRHNFKSSAVPAATSGLANDLLDYLVGYGGR